DEAQRGGGPHAAEEGGDGEAVELQEDRVDRQQHDEHAHVHVEGEHAELPDGVPAVARDGVAEQADGADRGEADDPPQQLLHDLERGAGEAQERLGLVAHLEHRDAHGDGDDEDLQRVEAQRDGAVIARGGAEAQEVRGHQAGEEVEPAALGAGGTLGGAVDVGVRAGRGDHAQRDADGHRDQGGDREPQQGLPCEAGRVGDVAQVRDRGDDREEDQRRDQGLQQRHEDRADGVQRGGQPVGALLAGAGAHLGGDEAEDDAEDQADQDLPAEGDAEDRAERVASARRSGGGGGGGGAHGRRRYAALL